MKQTMKHRNDLCLISRLINPQCWYEKYVWCDVSLARTLPLIKERFLSQKLSALLFVLVFFSFFFFPHISVCFVQPFRFILYILVKFTGLEINSKLLWRLLLRELENSFFLASFWRSKNERQSLRGLIGFDGMSNSLGLFNAYMLGELSHFRY